MPDYIPREIGAISIPVPNNRKAALVAHHTSAGLLQTDIVALIYTVHDDFVHVLFARGDAFPADPAANSFTTSLAIALPGHAEHRGDGVYIVSTIAGAAAIKSVANRISIYQGAPELVNAWAKDHNLPIHELPEEGGSTWTLPQYQRAQRDSRVLFALAMSGIAFAIFSGFNFSEIVTTMQMVTHDTNKIQASSTAYETQLRNRLSDVTDQPALSVIGRLYALGRINPETGGVLRSFTVSDGKISWTATVPDWVSNEQIDLFGAEIKRVRIADKKMLRLTATEQIR